MTTARLEWCIHALKKLGAAPPPSSRLPSALRVMADARGKYHILDETSIREKLAEVHRMAWEFMVILIAALEADPNTSVFTPDKLRQCLGGSLLPDSSHARNTQFELYVPALFTLGRFEVHRGHPDAQLRYVGEDFGIEVKRIQSLNPDTLRSALSEATRQIIGPRSDSIVQVVRARGFIAVNLDSYFESVDPSGTADELITQFETCLTKLDREARVLQDKVGIIGLLACGHVARWRQEGQSSHWRIDTLFPMRWLGLHGNDAAETHLANRFVEGMARIETAVLNLRSKVPRKK